MLCESRTRKAPRGVASNDLVLSACQGTNADLFPRILSLYVASGATVADVTYGRGVFWRNVDVSKYTLLKSDLKTGTDARKLPYDSGSIDCVVFDPPYMHSSGATSRGSGDHASFEAYYQNNMQKRSSDGHLDVLKLYFEAAAEAFRVLQKHGVYIVKCQDEICANRQRLTHVEIINELASKGWVCEDLFVLLQNSRPGVSRMLKQLHSRKAHSYFIIMRKAPPEGRRVWAGPSV